jgi:heme/copper-type cytochrome/quinol oxidase subunit 1
MNYLFDYLRHATLVNLGLVSLAIILTLVLSLAGIWVAYYSKSKVTVGSYTLLAFLPFLLCVLAVLVQWQANEKRYPTMENPAAYYAADRTDYITVGIIGIFLTILPMLIGIVGFLIPRRRLAENS